MSLLDLPSELLHNIIENLHPDQYPTLCMTHSIFNNLLQDDFLWRQLVLDQGRSHRSIFQYSFIRYSADVEGDGFETIDATMAPLLSSPAPYGSYHELFIKVFRHYAWMLGTFAGNNQWTGSIIEIFYNHRSGLIEARKLQTYAMFANPLYFSLANDVVWRDFDPLLEAWREPLFTRGPGIEEEQFSAQTGRLVAITDEATINVMPRDNVWPKRSVPVKDRIIVDQVKALSRLGNGFDQFSDNLLTISRPVLHGSLMALRGLFNVIPRHVELFYRIPAVKFEPSGFEGFSGLFMGDYSAHGPELIYLYYPTPTSLHAFKIEGDPNVPRGEFTWKIDDLTDEVRRCTEREWPGAHAYRGHGQVSPHAGFGNPMWIDTEVILYHAQTDRLPHTVQSNCNHAGNSLERLLGREEFAEEPQAGVECTARERLRVELPSIALWYKDMAHLTHFHKVTGISQEQKAEVERLAALYGRFV